MSSESNGSRPIDQLASENIAQIVEFVQNYAAAERERIGAANEPQLAVLEQRLEFLNERYQRLLREARAFADAACLQGYSLLAQAGHLSVTTLLTGAGLALAHMTMREFNVGQAVLWFCLGLAVVVPFGVHTFLKYFRQAWVHKLVVIAALFTGMVALVSLAEVRGDVIAHYLNSGPAVIVDGGAEAEPSPSGSGQGTPPSVGVGVGDLPPDDGDDEQVFAILRRAMIFAALGFELAAGLAFFAFCEARRNNDQGRRDRVEKELNRTFNEILVVIREIHELTAQPSREHAELCQRLQRSVLERINRTRNGGLGVVILAVVLTAASAQAADKLHLIAAVDLSQTQTAAYSGRSELEQNRDAITGVLARLPPGSGVTIIGITDQSYVNPYILLSAELTTETGYFNSRLAAGRRRLVGEWHKRSSGLAASFKGTDILGGLRYAGEVLARSGAGRKVLAVFSDGRNYSAELDLETPRLMSVGPALARLRKQGLLNSLTGVEVFLFGAGDHSGKRSTGYTLGLKDFWAAYIHEAGGRLVVFSTTREHHALQLVTAVPAGGTSP